MLALFIYVVKTAGKSIIKGNLFCWQVSTFSVNLGIDEQCQWNDHSALHQLCHVCLPDTRVAKILFFELQHLQLVKNVIWNGKFLTFERSLHGKIREYQSHISEKRSTISNVFNKGRAICACMRC